MLKRFHSFLMHSEWKLSLWAQLFGASGVLGTFGISAWAASATEWISTYGPIAWIFCGFAGSGFFIIYILLYAKSQQMLSLSKLNDSRSKLPTRVNILEDHFRKEIITVSDLFSHFHMMLSNKHFRECRFSGPMVIAFGNNVTLERNIMNSCNYIVVGDAMLQGVVGFSGSSFLECEFDSVTFIMSPNNARVIRDQAAAAGHQVPFLGLPLE